MRRAEFDPSALEDLEDLLARDRKLVVKAIQLTIAACRTPTEGIGKPEPLKHDLAGCWSRRITEEHRLIYRFDAEKVRVLACLYHYTH